MSSAMVAPTLLTSAPAMELCKPCDSGLPPPAEPLPAPTVTVADLGRMLDVIENEVLPKTALGVVNGNKVFGAAVLEDADGLPTVIAETNRETECPLYHGEVYTIKMWS